MSENYIVINGKRAELTAEQLKALGLEREIYNPFVRAKDGESYYFIPTYEVEGKVVRETELESGIDEKRHNSANYCTDREMMKQRALHETLNRLLWRYSMEHKGNEIDLKVPGWCYWIGYDITNKTFKVYESFDIRSFGKPYFDTEEIAESAIKEIIEPFMAEHPDFKL